MIDRIAEACALARVAPRLDDELTEAVGQRARKLGIVVPEAVAQWYAIPGMVEWVALRSDDMIPRVDELGTPYFDCDFTAAGYLMVAGDSQDSFQLAVPLDGHTPDPPVHIVDMEDLSVGGDVLVPEFSTYAYTLVWDAAAARLPHHATAVDVPFAESDLAALQNGMVGRPAWAEGNPRMRSVHRFEAEGVRVTVSLWRGRANLSAHAAIPDLLDGLPLRRPLTNRR